LRIGRASGSANDTSRSLIFSPRSLLDLGHDPLATVSQLLKPRGSAQLGLGAAAPCRGPRLLGEPVRFPDRAGQHPPRPGVQLHDVVASLAGAPG
jgi:hypothetical protein